jgi:hypothetical protein
MHFYKWEVIKKLGTNQEKLKNGIQFLNIKRQSLINNNEYNKSYYSCLQ